MPITIVSALPKSAPASAADTAAGAENGGAGQDFASLLLGQLADALPIAGSVMTAALESAEGEVSGEEDKGESSMPGDPLALLAALTQAPIEQRNEATLGVAPTATDSSLATETSLPAAGASTLGNAALADRLAQKTGMNTTSSETTAQTSAPANETAAKFAVPPITSSAKDIAAASESAEIPAAAANDMQPAAIAANPATIRAAGDTSATLSVPTPLRDRDWNNDFAQKVVWIATSHKQAAELTLNPPDMGNIEISLQFDRDKSTATATFVSTNAEVRETIETALPRLREMLAGVGIELGQTNVSAESFRQASGNENGTGRSSQSRSDEAILAPDLQASKATARTVVGMGRGLVDTFA